MQAVPKRAKQVRAILRSQEYAADGLPLSRLRRLLLERYGYFGTRHDLREVVLGMPDVWVAEWKLHRGRPEEVVRCFVPPPNALKPRKEP